MTHLREASLAATVLVVLAVASGSALGETLFTAVINEAQNVPPTGSGATGYAVLILNDDQTAVDYAITYENLEGTETASHFHKAPPGENGSPIFFLPLGTPKFGTWNPTTHDVADLFAGLVYVNIHTDLHISGEIRGNIAESATGVAKATEGTSWGRIKMLFR